MEGNGEGLVAIVQGLENSGVTLTVCNRSRQNHNQDRRPPVQRIQINALNATPDVPAVDQRPTVPAVPAAPARSTTPALQRASVETSTGSDFSRMATASQICDGRYASSYKLAHCMISPTSPPEAVTEFPPQRKEPCRNQGNFEIGGQSSAQWSGHGIGHNFSSHGTVPVRASTSRVRHYGGTQTWGDKGSSHRYSKSSHREMEAFAHSLRKYPSMAPFRTASTDFIEKLIRYTQAKNFQEVSRSTKSMRSLRHQKSSETYNPDTRASKHQQTYTRRQDGRVVNNSNVQIGHRGRPRNFKLYSPMSDSMNLRENRDTRCSSSYDYLKAGNPPYGRSNRSEGSRSPPGSGSPERSRSPEGSRSPTRVRSTDRSRNSDRSRNPNRSRSPTGSRIIRSARPSRCDRPLWFERSMRDLSLSEMSKYIRSTIRQICNERPVVVQVCPKLKARYHEHKKVCPNKNESSVSHVTIKLVVTPSFNYREQAGCQCTRSDCYCSKATQCVNNPNAATNTAACHCKNANVSCCRGMPCFCAVKSQDQAYYNKRIDEAILEWLKNVPVHSIEESESKNKRETIIKELRKTLKQLPYNENFEANLSDEIESFVNDLPLWNPGKDETDEKLFKSQLAGKLIDKIIALPRKPDRFIDIVKNWVTNMDLEDDGEALDKDLIIDNFVKRLKSLAVDRPVCDIKYTNLLRKEIIELLVEHALKFNGDMIMLKKMANNLATEIVSIPRNVILSGKSTDLSSEFEENIVDWICEHGMCNELKKNPKLIEGLAKKLNKLKSQGIFEEDVYEKMKGEVQQFVDDVGLAFETIDELIEELMKQLSGTVQMKEKERLDQEELIEVVSDWLRSLPRSDLHPRKFEKIVKDLVKEIQESVEQDNENLANKIVYYLVDTDLSIDSADLGIYVEELMEVLNILPSDKYYKEQAKRVMLKDIYDIIEVSPISEDQKEEMRSKARQIIEMNLRKSSFNLKRAPDNVKETLLEDVDNVVNEIDIPKDNRLLMKSRLSTSINKNFDKLFTRLIRNQSDLKQTIAKDVKNAVEELPINTNKKKDLMQKVKEILSKNMDKPLPSNVKNNIKEEIVDLVERCPICDDNNVIKRLSKILSAVASKHLNIWLPKCVCDIQSEVEKDICSVIDRSSMETGKKRKLKESIQDILTENENHRLSDEVIKTIKEGIHDVVSDLSIPQDKKDVLKNVAWETVSKDFNEAGKAFRHDLNKIKNKLFDDATNVIEKSPIPRDVKSLLKDKLKTVLARNLDYSLSDEEKHMLLDDVSKIVREDMSEEKRRTLTKKLAKKLDTHQRKEESNGLIDIINRLSIDSGLKDAMKKEIKDMLLETLYKPLTNDVQQNIMEGFLDAIDDNMDIPEHDKENLKSNISHTISKELKKLIAQDKEVPEIKVTLENTLKSEIKNSPISEDNQELLEKNLKDVLTENFVRSVTDEVKETIRERLEDILDDIIINKGKADAIKTQLLNVFNKDFDKLSQTSPSIESKEILEEETQTMNLKEYGKKTLENILLEMERAVDEAPIPGDKKIELKKKLKNLAIKNFKKPSDDISVGLKYNIDEIFDEQNFPIDKKNKLKRELTAAVDRNMKDLLGITRDEKGLMPIEEVVESEVKNCLFQGIEKIINESAVPEEKKIELNWKLKKLAAENLRKPFSDDVHDAINNGVAEIIDDLPIPKSEKNRLINALTDMVDKNLDKLQENLSADDTQRKFLQEMERVVDKAPILRDKKLALKKKLKNLNIKNRMKPLEHIAEGLKVEICEILDELNLPKDNKNKLKSELAATVDRTIKDLVGETRYTETEHPDTKQRVSADGKSKKVGKGLMPIEEVEESEVKNCIFEGIEKIINESAVLEEKKIELKRKLKIRVAENLRKPFSDDLQGAIKIGIAKIIDDLPISISEKNRLTNALTDMVDENLDNLRGVLRKLPTQVDNLKKIEEKTLDNILREMERTIEEAPSPKKKKAVTKERIYQGIEKFINESTVPEAKKMEMKRKLKRMAAEYFRKPFSEDIPDAIKSGIAEIIDDLPLPKSEKNKLKGALTNMVDKKNPLKTLTQVKEDEPLLNIFEEMERAIKEAPISREKKIRLKNKLQDLATKDFDNKSLDEIAEALNDGMIEMIDELNLPREKRNKLKSEIADMIHKNLEMLVGDPYELPIQLDHLKEEDLFKDETQRNNLLEFKKIIDEAPIPKEKKIELKKKLKGTSAKHFKEPLSGDVIEVLKGDINKIIDEQNLPKDIKNKQKRAFTATVDENLKHETNLTRTPHLRVEKRTEISWPKHVIDESNIKESMKDEIKKSILHSKIASSKKDKLDVELLKMVSGILAGFAETVDERLKDIFNKYDINPNYQKTLAEEFNKLLEIALQGGDFEDARKKLIVKFMRDLNLSEKEASALADELIDKARELARKEDVLEIQKIRAEVQKESDKMMDSYDDVEAKITEYKEAFAKAINNAVDHSSVSKPDKSSLKNKLLTKLKQTIDKSPNKNDIGALKAKVFKECKKIIDASSFPAGKKNVLKLLLTKELTKGFGDEIMDDYDDDEEVILQESLVVPETKVKKEDSVKPTVISKMQQTRDKTPPKKDLVPPKAEISKDNKIKLKPEEWSMVPEPKDKITEYKEAFAKAINNAIDQSTLSKPDKSNLKNKLLTKLKQTIDKSRNKNDIGVLKAEVFKECRINIDESSFPAGKKNVLKLLLKKELAKAFGDEIMDKYDDDEEVTLQEILVVPETKVKKEDSVKPTVISKMQQTRDKSPPKKDLGPPKAEVSKYTKIELKPEERQMVPQPKDKITEYKDGFAKAINNALEQSILSKADQSTLKNELLSKMRQIIDNSPNKNDIGALKAEVFKECKKNIDAASFSAGKKNELKLLLKKELAKAFGDEIMDDYDDDEEDTLQEILVVPDTKVKKEDSVKPTAISKMQQTRDKSTPKKKFVPPKAEILKDKEIEFKPEERPMVPEPGVDKLTEYKEAFAKTINNALDQSNLSKPDKSTLKNKLFRKMRQIIEKSHNKNDIRALTAEVFKEWKNIIETSLLPASKNEELKILLKKEVRKAFGETDEMIIDEESSDEGEGSDVGEAFGLQEPTSEEYKANLIENIKTWMDSLPIDLDPEAVAEYLASDILDRQKYLQAHPKAISSENDEIENFKYQVFRRMNHVVDPKDLPKIMERTEGLYMMIMDIEPPAGVQKLHPSSSREQSTSQRRTRDQVQDKKTSIIAALSTGNVNYSLEDLIATNKNVRKQWSKNLNDVIAKLPLLRKEQTDKLAIYDETGQIDLLSTLKRAKEEIDTVDSSKSTKPTLKNNIGKLTSRLSKVKEAYALSKTSRKKPHSNSNSKQDTDGKDNSNKSYGKTQRKLGPADILGIRSKATNTTKPDGTPHTAESDAESGLEDNSEPEFNPGQASTPSKETSKQQKATEVDYSDRVTESVTVWLDSMPIDLEPYVKTDVIKDLVTDIVDRQKYLQAHPDKKFSDDEEIESLRFQVFKRLDKVMESDSSVTLSLAKMEELYKMINGDARGRKILTAKQAQEFQTALNEEISAILNEYRICCDKRELLPNLASELTKLRKSGADQDDIVENLITTIKRFTYLSDDNAEELAYKLLYRTKKLIATIRGDVVKKRDFREAMMKDIGDVFEGRPMSQTKRRMMESQLAEGYADELGIPLQESNVTMSDTGPESKKEDRYGMSFNGLSNFIDTWLSSIHTDEDDEKDENEIMDMKKERMYFLIHKIGEMNVDPEIFNDDSLYEAILREELQNLYGDDKINDEEFQVLTEDLVEKVLEAQHRAHDEIAGQTYKKNLRDTISTLLPDQRNMSKEDQATIETLKDQLADAYIDLHYSGNNENQRDELKRKISNAINTFCRDYLNRNPCSSLNSKNLNQDLYAVLNKVPLPTGDSIKYEVEQARIREEINVWVKELPLQPQSPTELLARNKLIYVLSKKLFDMELEGQEEEENNDLIRTEIVKFLNKLPLESEEDNDAIADTLIDKLRASEASRKYNSTSNVTIDNFGNVSAASKKSSMESPVCPGYKWLLDKRKPCPRKVCGRQGPRRYELPPCTLSPKDHAHLERIRRRTCLSPSCVTSLMRKNKRHLGARAPPVDAGSQTVLRPFGIQEPQQSPICPSAFEKTPRPCPRVSANLPRQPCAQGGAESIEMEKPQQSSICPAAHDKTPRTCPGASRSSPQSSQQMRRRTISSSNMSESIGEVQPNNYCYDPSEKNSMDESELHKSGRSSRRQSESPPCHSPVPGPCHPPWQGPCYTPRLASSRPAPSNSPGAASCKLAPCQKPRPAPCHTPRPASCRPAPCHSPRLAPCNPLRPPPCFPPGPLPCGQSRTCFSQPSPAPCRRPSLGRVSPRPKSPRQNSSERYSYCDPHSSIFLRPSHRDILGSRSPCSRSPCSPSPCMSPFGIHPQYTPPGSPCFSKRMNECRMPKRDGLQDQPSNSSRPSQKERVIELGSLDDASNARPKKRPNEQYDWPKFHEDDNFWAVPMRRVILDEGIDDSLVMERERREERVSCRCKERLVPKCGKPGTSSKEDGQNLKRCSKCCGIHCPYPSFLYFRQ